MENQNKIISKEDFLQMRPGMWIIEHHKETLFSGKSAQKEYIQYYLFSNVSEALSKLLEQTLDQYVSIQKFEDGHLLAISKQKHLKQHWVIQQLSEEIISSYQKTMIQSQDWTVPFRDSEEPLTFPVMEPIHRVQTQWCPEKKDLIKDMAPKKAAFVYIFFDQNKDPLYVGYSSSFKQTIRTKKKMENLWEQTEYVGLLKEDKRIIAKIKSIYITKKWKPSMCHPGQTEPYLEDALWKDSTLYVFRKDELVALLEPKK